MTATKLICPRCGKRKGVPLAYGFPGEEGFKSAERGEIVLGGCVLGMGEPLDTACTACEFQWCAKADGGL